MNIEVVTQTTTTKPIARGILGIRCIIIHSTRNNKGFYRKRYIIPYTYVQAFGRAVIRSEFLPYAYKAELKDWMFVSKSRCVHTIMVATCANCLVWENTHSIRLAHFGLIAATLSHTQTHFRVRLREQCRTTVLHHQFLYIRYSVWVRDWWCINIVKLFILWFVGEMNI